MRLRVRDVMTADPVSVTPEMTLREVAEVLSQRRVTGVPVIAPGEGLVGVVSASDLIDFIASTPGVPTVRTDQVEWGEFAAPDTDVSPEAPAGSYFFDFWDDAGADVMERFDEIDGPEWNVLEEHTAAEVMSRRIVAVSPDVDVHEAAHVMLSHGVHRLLVVADGALRGVITGRDLLGVMAEAVLAGGAVASLPSLRSDDAEC